MINLIEDRKIEVDTLSDKSKISYAPGVCHTCLRKCAAVELLGDECYLCTLKKWPPQGYFHAAIYRKAVAISLALATPLTIRQARRVVRIAGLKNMKLLNEIQGWKVSPDLRPWVYSMAVDAAKEVRK